MNSADKQYQDLLKKIIETGKQKGDRTGTGTISIPFATLDFDMSEGIPLLTTKRVFTKGVIHELLWFLRGDTNIKYLVDNDVNIWTSDAYREFLNKPSGLSRANQLTMCPSIEDFIKKIKTDSEFAAEWGELGPVYGAQWRNWIRKDGTCIDQIQQVMDKLMKNPDDRRIMVSAWNIDDIDQMALPPCHYGFQLYTEELTTKERLDWAYANAHMIVSKEGWIDLYSNEAGAKVWFDSYDIGKVTPKRKISLIWDQRSCDTFLGIPFNIASYGILLHMFAQQANMIPDRLIGSLKNVHIYNNHKEQCLEQISREPRLLPKLELRKAKNIFSYKYDDIKILDYNPHKTIKGDISV